MLKRIFAAGTVLLLVLSSASAKMTVEEKEFRLINTFLALQIYLSQIRTADHLMTFENLKNFKLPLTMPTQLLKTSVRTSLLRQRNTVHHLT